MNEYVCPSTASKTCLIQSSPAICNVEHYFRIYEFFNIIMVIIQKCVCVFMPLFVSSYTGVILYNFPIMAKLKLSLGFSEQTIIWHLWNVQTSCLIGVVELSHQQSELKEYILLKNWKTIILWIYILCFGFLHKFAYKTIWFWFTLKLWQHRRFKDDVRHDFWVL